MAICSKTSRIMAFKADGTFICEIQFESGPVERPTDISINDDGVLAVTSLKGQVCLIDIFIYSSSSFSRSFLMQYFRSIFFHLFPLKKVKIGKLKLNRLVDMAVEEEAGVVSDADGAVEIEGEDVVEIKIMIDFSVITLL